jgi:hypothetical protein
VITMEGNGVIAMDGGSSNGQGWWCHGRWDGGAMRWVMRQQWHETIAADAEAAQWEFGILDFALGLLADLKETRKVLQKHVLS